MKTWLQFLENTNWFQQVAAILTIIGIPYAFLKLVFYKAKHKIFFDPKETYHERELVNHPKRLQSFWLHLMVKNKGYEISKNTEAYLSDIWIEVENKYQKLEGFNSPVKLKWAHEEDIYPINIFPKEKRRLDICYICETESILYLMVKGFPSGSIKNILEAGKYLFVIKVASENSLKPAEFIFQVFTDGSWRNLSGNKYIRSFKLYKKPVKTFHVY